MKSTRAKRGRSVMGNMRMVAVRCLSMVVACIANFAGLAQAERLVDPQQLEAWADEYYGRAIAEKRSPGITISVVQDAEVIFAKGYGYADYGRKIPVDPEQSGFIVGSITKTFIATAIGQLIDSGAIKSFDDPANQYLKRVQLPGERGARVTIGHLLNHRAGFEDIDFGFLDRRGKDAQIPLSSAEVMRFMPQLVMEPGGPAVYSNWSFSLLGFLIEDVTGQRIDTYLKEHIWAPLGMSHTSLVYGTKAANMSVVYAFEKDGTPVVQPHHPPHPWIGPAGTIVSTASDMARYMNAHVLQGEGGTPALVSKEMFEQLHKERFRNAPISIGFAHTFWTTQINGAQTIEHGGGAPGFQSMMVMIPEKRFGFFISAMQGGLVQWSGYSPAEIASGNLAVRDPPTGFELRESFIERFLQPAPVEAQGPKIDPRKLVGTYWQTRRPFTSVEILGQAFDPAAVLTIELADDGQGVMMSGSGPYTQIGNGVFVSRSGKNEWTDPYTINRFAPPYISFELDAAGNAASFVPGLADQVWKPVSSIFNPRALLIWFVVFGTVAATGLLLFLWPQAARFADSANRMGALVGICALAFPCAILVGFAQDDSLVNQMALGDRTRLWVMVIAANATFVLAALMAFRAAKEWSRPSEPGVPGWARLGRRIHVSAVAVSAVALLIVYAFFNLISVNMPG